MFSFKVNSISQYVVSTDESAVAELAAAKKVKDLEQELQSAVQEVVLQRKLNNRLQNELITSRQTRGEFVQLECSDSDFSLRFFARFTMHYYLLNK